jgi:hypothetical protein
MKSPFSPHLFWDVDSSKLKEGTEGFIRFVIERTITHGLMQDWKLIVEKYGYAKIEQVALQMRSLDDVSLAFLCSLFDKKKKLLDVTNTGSLTQLIGSIEPTHGF